MKKITLWLFAFFTCWQMSAQVGISQNFDSSTTLPTGWTQTGGKIIAAAESCSGNSIRDNLFNTTTGTLVTPNQVAGSNGTDLAVAFDYKIENWNVTTPRAAGWGNIQVQYSTNDGTAWTTFFTINDGNHIVANTCANFSNVIPAASLPSGSSVKIRFLFTWLAGDYDIYIDNFSAIQTTVLPPACTVLTTPANAATNVMSSNIVWNSATGVPTGYKLKVGTLSGGTDVLNLFDVGNVTNYNLGTLAAGTTYYVTVVPYNANGDATGCTESSFTTCGAVASLPHLESFATFLPTCWTEADNGDLIAGPVTFGTGVWSVGGLGNVGSTGAIKVNIDATGDNDWIISPEFTIPASGYELKFDAAATQWNTANTPTTTWESDDSIEVLISTTGNTNWTVLHTYNNTNQPSITATAIALDLGAYATQNVKFAFRAVEGATNGGADIDFTIDNFEIRLAPTCPDQTGLVFSNVTDTGVETSWDPMPGAVGYQYAITTLATPPASGTFTAATVYVQSSGLTPQTVYYLHVRSECAGSTYGNWATVTFTTQCAPVTTLPHLEPFNTFLPNTCWMNGVNGNLTAGPSAFTVSGWGADGFANAGTTGAIRNNIDLATANDWVISPQFTIPTAGYELKFDAAATQYNNTIAPTTPWEADDLIEVLVSTTGTTNWTVLHTYNNTNQPNFTGTAIALDLDVYSGQTVRFAYRAVEGAANGSADIDFSIDNFEIRLSPICPDQTGLTYSNVTATGVETSWDTMPGAVGYEYAITTSATPPASGTSTTATVYVQSSGLTPQTVYYLHVRSECAGSTYGNWATVSFTTSCVAITTLPHSEGFDAVANPNCWTTALISGTTNWVPDTNNDGVAAPRTGTRFAGKSWAGNDNALLISPAYDLSAYSTSQTAINVWIYRSANGIATDRITFHVNTTNNLTGATQLLDIPLPITEAPTVASAGWYNYMVDVPLAYNTGGNFYIIAQGRTTSSFSSYGIGFDDYALELSTLSSDSFDKSNFVAYPNPVKDVLNLSYKTTISNVSIINLLGQEVLNTKANTNDVRVNMSALTAGAYIVNITVEDTVHTIKVIKE